MVHEAAVPMVAMEEKETVAEEATMAAAKGVAEVVLVEVAVAEVVLAEVVVAKEMAAEATLTVAEMGSQAR